MQSKFFLTLTFTLALFIFSCNTANKKEDNSSVQQRVQAYLDSYNPEFQKVLYADNLAQWVLQTHIVEGDSISKQKADSTGELKAQFTGSIANIDSAKKF